MYCRSALIRQTRNWANIGLITVNLYAFAHAVLDIWLREYLDTPKSQTQLRDSDFGYHVIQPLEAHIHVYTYFVYGESGLLGDGGNGKCNVI